MTPKPMLVKFLELDGLKLNGNNALSSDIQDFFRAHQAEIEVVNGYLKLSGKFSSLSKAKWEEFQKANQALKEMQEKRKEELRSNLTDQTPADKNPTDQKGSSKSSKSKSLR